MMRVHFCAARDIDLFEMVFEELATLLLNRSLASFTLIGVAAFMSFQETCIVEIKLYLSSFLQHSIPGQL